MGLTIKEIENAKPRDKRYKIADGGGLCLLVCARTIGHSLVCSSIRLGDG